jgi:hypothetical protein
MTTEPDDDGTSNGRTVDLDKVVGATGIEPVTLRV